MRPAPFSYSRPASIDEALEQLAESGDRKPLAGGHSMIPAMNQRLAEPGHLIDIGRISDLKGIRGEAQKLTVGALTTHAEIAASDDVERYCPALAQACGMVGDPQVRNFGTIGGNLAHADPASDPPIAAVACDAEIHLRSRNGSRSVPATDFFQDLFTVDLQEGELIESIEFPGLTERRAAYVKQPHPASRYALVGVCVVLDMDGGRCRSARVAVGGATPKATRCTAAEEAVTGSDLGREALEASARAAVAQLGDTVLGDFAFPAEYRRAMIGVFFKRAIRKALGDRCRVPEIT